MDDRGNRQSERVVARDGRGQRLAAALRANLARRKKQALARSRADERDCPAETAGGDPSGSAAAETPHDSAEIVRDKTFG
jgi:hypothetical protein